jgi:hypothetical protein
MIHLPLAAGFCCIQAHCYISLPADRIHPKTNAIHHNQEAGRKMRSDFFLLVY